MTDVPFMLQQQALPNGGVGMGNDGYFGMGMWGQQPTSTPQLGTGVPFAPKYGGYGAQSTGAPPTTGWWDKIGGMEGLGQGLSAFGNLANIYMGFKSLGLAKDQFQFAKSSFNKNFNAQAQAYNNQLKDRWEARSNAHATRGRTYEGMDSWLSGRTIDKVGNGKKKGG